MTIKTIIWDFGGVLYRTEDRCPRTRLAESLGMTYRQLAGLVYESESGRAAQQGSVTPEQHWKTVCGQLKIPPEQLTNFQEAFWGGDILDETLVDYIRSLRGSYITALLSNAWGDMRRMLAQMWGIADAFEKVIISAEERVMKPDARIYEIALNRIGVLPEEVVFIDDSTDNIAAAEQAGWRGVLFESREQVLERLSAILNGQP